MGVAKPSVAHLPGNDFVYGVKANTDAEGTREVLHVWVEHETDAGVKPGRDFKAMNKACAMMGNVNSKDVSGFRATHDIRVRRGERKAGEEAHPLPSSMNPQHVYGKKVNRDGGIMGDLMSCKFQHDFEESQAVKAAAHTAGAAAVDVLFARSVPVHILACVFVYSMCTVMSCVYVLVLRAVHDLDICADASCWTVQRVRVCLSRTHVHRWELGTWNHCRTTNHFSR